MRQSVSFDQLLVYVPLVMEPDRRFGNYLARLVGEQAWDIRLLASKMQVSPTMVYDYLKGVWPRPRRREEFASLLMPENPAGFESGWKAEPLEPTQALLSLLARIASANAESQPSGTSGELDPNSAANFLKARGETPPENSEHANIQHAPRVIPSIPEWTAEIACGQWIDCTTIAMDMDNHAQADTARRGMFIVRCMGDSMTPTYKPGARVLFRVVRLDDEALRVGVDYYWQNSDGQCTLKRLKEITEDEYVLAPLNKKYKPLRLGKQMLAKVAIVETIVRAPWE